MSIPSNFEARRLGDIHQDEFFARWLGDTLPARLSPGSKDHADPGDWIIRRSDGTVRIEGPGSQIGYCADCGEPVWWHAFESAPRLVTREGRKWCYGPDRSRVSMEREHALPGMHQYVAPAPDGQSCHCVARRDAHVHQIVPVPEQAPGPQAVRDLAGELFDQAFRAAGWTDADFSSFAGFCIRQGVIAIAEGGEAAGMRAVINAHILSPPSLDPATGKVTDPLLDQCMTVIRDARARAAAGEATQP